MNKTLRFISMATTFACVSVLMSACSSTPEDQKAVPVDERSPLASSSSNPNTSTSGAGGSTLGGQQIPPGGVTNTSTPSSSSSSSQAGGRNALRDPSNPLSRRSIFYDYDSFVVKDEFKPIIESHGRYLRDSKAAQIVVQGNTDDRGSREYNLALGHKRAESVKRMLSIMGVQEAQVETVSFGKEKPKNPGSGESAWAENRRSDIVYQGE